MLWSYSKSTLIKIKNSKRLSQILILASFLATFVLSRIITYFQKTGLFPILQHGDTYIHHLVPGIFLILFSGYVGLSFWSTRRIRSFMSVLFGIGAALTIDEFALWLYLEDVYWTEQGRTSIDAVIITIALLTIAFVWTKIYDRRLKD